MIVNGSDAFDVIADMVADSDVGPENVLVDVVSSVHHLCDQYELKAHDVLANGRALYQIQVEKEFNELEASGDVPEK